jgi:hypothetical protein
LRQAFLPFLDGWENWEGGITDVSAMAGEVIEEDGYLQFDLWKFRKFRKFLGGDGTMKTRDEGHSSLRQQISQFDRKATYRYSTFRHHDVFRLFQSFRLLLNNKTIY